ncbi:MAG TPA: heparan-alpha-glucosaminide N-acetyltransferase domain-containing protein [Cyclobacteriaceae bacterium]|nr:heparan-alpha-glucosaminide N-acetyltransferase domain-containing protein [Cyclobacteriaceae bacterium]
MELKNRYLSLDVFRGMDVALMIIVNTAGDSSTTFGPLHHAKWHGFTITDLVFPTFLFVVGISMSFSLKNYQAMGSGAVLWKILRRTAIIFLLGYLMYWFPFVTENASGEVIMAPMSNTRIFGVLQRIALCYGLAAIVIHFLKIRGAVIFGIVALLTFWILLVAFGDLTLTGNAVLALDRWLIGEAHMYHGEGLAFDPEGLLSTLPATVNVIIGYLAGFYFREKGASYETIARFLMAGAVMAFVALAWDLVFPINKKLWTSSFVLYTCGIDLMFLGILIYIIDIRQAKGWTYFFEVFGRNTLALYLVSEIFAILMYEFRAGDVSVYRWTFVNLFYPWAGGYFGSLAFAVSFMLMCWLVGYWMDKRKFYIKL